MLLSLDLLEELNDVFSRSKFDRYLSSEEREDFLEALIERSVLVEITEHMSACRDPSDDKVLELAVNGKAKYIISGDKDLLVLNPFRHIVVITADEFLKKINKQV